MGVTITYSCGGWRAARWIATAPQICEGGFVTKRAPSIPDLAPEGWMVYDPYTGCTYCPTCWDSIENDLDEPTAQPGDTP